MKPPRERIVRSLVQQWIAKADLDYRTAQSLLRDPEPIRESIAFHCPHAGEKYLKAFLVWKRIEFPKTHSISQLLDLVSSVAPELASSLESSQFLTPYGVEMRYPSDFPEMLPGQEETAFGLARNVREAILAQLMPYVEEE